jgi:hypothetical protein
LRWHLISCLLETHDPKLGSALLRIGIPPGKVAR